MTSISVSSDWDYPPWSYPKWSENLTASKLRGEGLPDFLQWFPEKPFDWIALHSLDFWLTSEDLPIPQNRIFLSTNTALCLDLD